jgi:hypothetical protein
VHLTGQDDAVHFDYAQREGRIVVTKNPDDFRELHRSVNGRHPGVIAIHQDNDINRDMNYQDIVAAIARLEQTYTQAGQSLAGQVHDLNQWRVSPSQTQAPPDERPPPMGAKSPRKRGRQKGK